MVVVQQGEVDTQQLDGGTDYDAGMIFLLVDRYSIYRLTPCPCRWGGTSLR